MGRPPVLAVVGATATGKTQLAEVLAETVAGEVVCADSRQVFRELEIGTGKPPPALRQARPHHLFEALSLGERASAGWYARACLAVREEVRAKSRLPILVGGSGLYLRAAQRGLSGEPPHDAGLRRRLQDEIEALGPEELHRRLAVVDPIVAARIGNRDRQRIARALEVFEASGRPLSWWHATARPQQPGEQWQVVELCATAQDLDQRIATRTRWMFEAGLVEETRALLAAQKSEPLQALHAVGYDEALGLIEGRWDRGEAERRTNLRTRQLAKRQRTWFRHQVTALRLEARDSHQALARQILDRIDRGGGSG